MKGLIYIICFRKEDYKEIGDNPKEFKCSQCEHTVMIGKLTMNQADEKAKDKWKPLCHNCLKKMPRNGKIIRPDEATINKMREEYEDFGELEIRESLRKVRELMGSEK